ncbi:DUF2158 domain-containing protein [Kaistia soli]|uniref:DUF2158 domain-containing protein n=1 Tax=Kaistia soli TaxID=446684 RepID=UPI003CC80AE1
MAEQLKVGDIVRLRAGGPRMVVVSVVTTPSGADLVGCRLLDVPQVSSISVPAGQLVTEH